jgi:PPOX class probable F420-dependent enzyme
VVVPLPSPIEPASGASALPAISDATRRFLEAPRFAVIAVLNPDGAPLQAVIWYRVDGDTIVFNSRVGRQWPSNLARDRRVSFVVADGYDYVELRGRVEIDPDPERGLAVISDLTRRYHRDPEEIARNIEAFRRQERVTFVLRPERIFEHFND